MAASTASWRDVASSNTATRVFGPVGPQPRSRFAGERQARQVNRPASKLQKTGDKRKEGAKPGIKVKRRKAKENRAAIYARVSDQSQDAEDKTSITEQTSEMEAHCERRGLTVVARYQEVGQGWSKKRPEFQRMLADARRGRFDTIVCWKSDRLGRGMYPAAALMEVVEAHQIEIEAVMDAIDMKTFGLMAAIGKIELDNFRERASMGKRGTAKQGPVPVSNVPYGYRVGDDGRPRDSGARGRCRAAHLPDVREGRIGGAGDWPAADGRRRSRGQSGQALVRRSGLPHPEQRDLQGHLVVRQGPLHLHGGRDTGPREGQGHVDTGAVP